ncbi:hypothetical protein [Streptomyces sp. NPDC013457]|uniref:hypothetical protein n=1 Tax=Streptomyces sp. NPDC013457 TaxID=3364866 RepID=UPI003702D7F7
MAADSYAGHSPLALILIILIGLPVAGALIVYGGTNLARRGIRRTSAPLLLRCAAALAAAAAAALYVWGSAHLVLMDETRRDQACKQAVGPAQSGSIDAYQPSFIPLGLGCHVSHGVTYQVGVPGYVNPAAASLSLSAVALTVSAARAQHRRDSRESKEGF